MKRKYFATLFLSMVIVCCHAQNQHLIDSLYHQLSLTQNETLQVDYLNQISAHFLFTNTIGAKVPAQKACSLAENSGYKRGQMDAINRLGIMHYRLSNYDSALFYYEQGTKLAQAQNDSNYIIKFKKNIALSLTSNGKYKEALDIYYQVLAYIGTNDTLNTAKNTLDIASVYYYLNDYKKAYDTALEGYKLAQRCNNKQTIANAMNSIGVFLKSLNRNKEALEYYKKFYVLSIELGDKLAQITALINIANIYFEEKDYLNNLVSWDSVLMLSKEIDAKQNIAMAYQNKGHVLYELKQYNESLTNAFEGYKIYKDIKSNKELISAAIDIANCYEAISNYKKANKYFREAIELKDTLFNDQMAESIAEMRTRFDTEKKEQENIQLIKENEIKSLKIKVERNKKHTAIISLVFVVLLFIILIYIYKQKQKQQLQQQLLYEKKLRLKSIIEAQDQERSRIARDLHDGIGQTLSAASMKYKHYLDKVKMNNTMNTIELNESVNMLDTACEELRTISHQMMPRALKESGLPVAINDLIDKTLKNSKIDYDFDTFGFNKRLPEPIEIGIYRICQELINNVIKHAACNEVSIQLFLNNNELILIVEDNGSGIETENHIEGMGLMNIKSRAEVIGGSFTIEKAPLKGTVATIKIPVGIKS